MSCKYVKHCESARLRARLAEADRLLRRGAGLVEGYKARGWLVHAAQSEEATDWLGCVRRAVNGTAPRESGND